ncbi:amine acid ABC transporter, permease protein, 3-TM region, His/Glu/Gln/Arg/opine family [Beggiatoa alba B18LD]|uniref:Amine acid ABC transporter, permease protein, 3-TM region, His/Glu/Gln/Arg/opine family n=1 Tax=Beggiatoa alba B18LD TaxID=395493 RepID=I3CGQ0_9GAMM|nr:ABC transporter permease [Beggiatoa alba]EIJ42793.1 amine acid ABC transporter, permease protein, 3-TM region, His/Glu/Gln/Arg/opine family [Beggiatoa alba B18LD]
MFDLHGYGASILAGALLTIEVSLLSLCIATGLGLVGALARLSTSKIASSIAMVYTTVIRGIPDLVLMLLIFYGGQLLINQLANAIGYDDYIDINPFIAGVLTIGFIFGAYMTETFRGAILAIPRGQLEAAYAFGMTRGQVFWRILLPQMIPHALPSFGNNWLVLLKATALVSVIGLDDMVRKATLAAGATRLPFTFYLVVALGFLGFTTVSILCLKWLEHRYRIHTKTI